VGDIFFSRQQIEESAAVVRARIHYQSPDGDLRPRVGLVLGSGLGPLAEAIEHADVIPYSDIPNVALSTVEGHVGRLVIGILEGQSVIVMQGRSHYYEGYSMQQVTLPVRIMQLVGVEILVVTNAAGGLAPDLRPGDLMLITDHINLIGMAGLSPLRGPNDPSLGPRFPEMTEAYDAGLRNLALRVAAEQNIKLHKGVYICLAGPSFETPADLRFLRKIGADAVGMSTVPEVTIARHGGLRVLGISGISNVAMVEPGSAPPPTHEEVLQAGQVIVPKLTALIRGVLRSLPARAV
jgi:purine-nucleoside phosphorylase